MRCQRGSAGVRSTLAHTAHLIARLSPDAFLSGAVRGWSARASSVGVPEPHTMQPTNPTDQVELAATWDQRVIWKLTLTEEPLLRLADGTATSA